MNPFTHHPRSQGFDGWYEHFKFASGIALRLTRSACAFIAHALVPLCPIKKELDLEATCKYLEDCNDHVESKS